MARDNRILGTFNLDGIAPAPRGMPKIDVTFDIDANGILNVSAKDQGSGKENKVTITGSTTLQKEEVERMVKEAEAHAEEDRQRAEVVEVKNRAEHLAYQAEKALADAGEKVPGDVRGDIESKIRDVREAVSRNDPDAMKKTTDALQGSIQKIGEAVYASTSAAGGDHGGNGGPPPGQGAGKASGSGGDDVVDAEFKEV
jgi:molecular chaperone DnaK